MNAKPDPMDAVDAISIRRAPTADEVWDPLPAHVEGLHREVSRRLARSMAAVGDGAAPVASVVIGERGTGKTHLLTWARQQIQEAGGYFFYIKLVTGFDFWTSAVTSIVDSLYRVGDEGQTQVSRLLAALAHRARLDDQVRSAIFGKRELTPADLAALVRGLRNVNHQVAMTAADTIRALVLVASSDTAGDVGNSYLALADGDVDRRMAWGMSGQSRSAHLLLRDLARVIALGGPLVFAFDQLDGLVAASERSLASPSTSESPAARRLSADIATGLMELREEARNTLMIVACQPDTWAKIRQEAVRSSLDRFDVLPALGAIPDEATAAAIVSSRLHAAYASVGFTPTYPTWPITPAALAEAPHRYSARRLLTRVDAHITACQRARVVTELTSLRDVAPAGTEAPASPPAAELDALTELFQKLRDEVDDLAPLSQASEDRHMPGLLGAALRSVIRETGADVARFRVEMNIGSQAALHARLVYTVDEAREEEMHWSFRAIAAEHPRAVQTRMCRAMVEAGIEAGLRSRRLILLRNIPISDGPRSVQIKADFFARGGQSFPISAADLRTFGALARMLQDRPAGLDAWLRRERPAAQTEFLQVLVRDLARARGDVGLSATGGEDATAAPAETASAADVAETETGTSTDTGATETSATETSVATDAAVSAEMTSSDITIGWTVRGNRPFTVPLEQLRKHTLAIGASGSGKTVLIKRIIEECALRGVSAIVLDPNGDLAQLGDRPPDAAVSLPGQDAHRAERYFTEVEVVIWTPGVSRGRPLVFRPIPDFRPVLDDDDDFARLLNSTAVGLAPQAGIRGSARQAVLQRSILRRALERLARDGGRTVAELIDILAEPPADLVNGRTRNLAVQMADTLQAALELDRLGSMSGEVADPGVLLTPSPGKSARISVISFIGLGRDEGSAFVQRLQAAVFAWFRANPTRNRPLGGLLVMDEAQEFVPSKKANPSTASTIELIRQIRKYGLGMVLASQMPKGLSHEVVSNTAHQFIGRLTAPVQLAAADQMAAARNSPLDNLAGLGSGTFYAAGEGTPYAKIRVARCLTHHAVPLDEDEIVERARRSD